MGKMKVKIASLALSAVMLVAADPSVMAAPPIGGSGTVANPYVLDSKEDLKAFSDIVNSGASNVNAKLVANIDATGLNMNPIGDSDNPYTGTFDGQDHVISNLNINKPNSENVGFFGYTAEGSVIKNLGLKNETVSGGFITGGLIGRSYSKVIKCFTTGKIKASNYADNIGGLVGNNHVIIEDSYSKATVIASGNRVGGLVGQNAGAPDEDAKVTNSHAEGSVSGRGMVGKLVGENCTFGSVENSSASGSASGLEFVGGDIGRVVH